MTKIPMTTIAFGFSEAEGLGNRTFTTWGAADRAVLAVAGDMTDRGYYKTDFTVTFADGYVYQGRLNVNANEWSVSAHILAQCEFGTGLHCPAHLTPAQYKQHLSCQEHYQPGSQARYRELLTTYQIGDPVAPVVVLAEVKGAKLVNAWSPTQRLMLSVAGAFLGNEVVATMIVGDSTPESVFTALADAIPDISSQVIMSTMLTPTR